jgi:hypothetical protein
MASTPTIVREGSDRPPTDLDKKMHETMSAWYQLQDAHDQKAARLDQIEETNRSLMAENESQRQRSGYRPPPAGTPREPQNRPGDDGEPIPRFLQKPPKEDITGQD